jgi:hypothetical protein
VSLKMKLMWEVVAFSKPKGNQWSCWNESFSPTAACEG